MSARTALEMAYVGKKACGCIVMAAIDNPAHARDVAREVSWAIRHGLTVSKMSVEQVRTKLRICPHDKPKRARKVAA